MKNYKLLVASVLIFLCINVTSQETLLYNGNGTLKCDSSFIIEKKMLVRMPQIESNLISIYNSIEYPREAYENSITGIVIAKVHVNYDKLEVWCDIVKSAHPLFNDPIKIAIQNNSLSILKSLKNTEEEIIYLPFDFNITATSFTEDLKKNEVIKIHKDYKYNRF